MRLKTILVGGTLCLAALSGCTGEQKPVASPLHYTENAKRAYDAALVAYFDRDWELANQLFGEVKRKYGYSRYARLSELRLADIAFHQEKFAEAVGMYKSYVSDYPNDPEVSYARYKIAKSEFVQSGASILLPPLEERDLSNVRDAHVALRALVADFPDSAHGVELNYMLAVVTGLLARHELYVARFYLNRDGFDAAVARCQYALQNYQDSGLEPEALVLLGETYLKMKELDKARSSFQLILDKYPESAFTVPARHFLERMARVASSPHASTAEPHGG
ncbi:MAG TPA: outer membrane protein assembly factor BamD [Polyangiaceae bacterium]|jgi:outer membrane protein assembly factor BamD|nr:outer membrane protein assembly factor BamD [Polyangiaceae bacterium]